MVWKLPIYNTVLKILTNPVYAGAYAFGRTETRVRIEAGRKCVVRGHRRERENWHVLIEPRDGRDDVVVVTMFGARHRLASEPAFL